jgi:hypothetical protein
MALNLLYQNRHESPVNLQRIVRTVVLKAMVTKHSIFWDMTPCSQLDVNILTCLIIQQGRGEVLLTNVR